MTIGPLDYMSVGNKQAKEGKFIYIRFFYRKVYIYIYIYTLLFDIATM